jgi:hypothetical protein
VQHAVDAMSDEESWFSMVLTIMIDADGKFLGERRLGLSQPDLRPHVPPQTE